MSQPHLIIDSQRDRQVHYATGNVRVIPPGVHTTDDPKNSFWFFFHMANLHKSINIKTNNISLLPGWWICFAGTLLEQEPPEDAKNVWSIVVVFWVVAVVAVVVAAGAVGSKDSRWNLGCVDTPWESKKKKNGDDLNTRQHAWARPRLIIFPDGGNTTRKNSTRHHHTLFFHFPRFEKYLTRNTSRKKKKKKKIDDYFGRLRRNPQLNFPTVDGPRVYRNGRQTLQFHQSPEMDAHKTHNNKRKSFFQIKKVVIGE